MSKDSSYEVEHDEPVAIWTNFSHYDFINKKLAVLCRFLADKELARYCTTQLHFKLSVVWGDNKDSVIAAAVPSSFTLHCSDSEVTCIARSFINSNATKHFDKHGFVVRIFHGDLAKPYATYELRVTSSGEVAVKLEEFCFGHKWDWIKVAQLSATKLTSKEAFELIYLDWMRELEIIAAVAVSSAHKDANSKLIQPNGKAIGGTPCL